MTAARVFEAARFGSITAAPGGPSMLPFAAPKSALPGVLWPAVPDAKSSALLALQFQLEQSQWWPPEVIEAHQFRQLHGVLAHAQRTVPFYGERLAAAGFDARAPLDRALWSRIPIMTRTDVQSNRQGLRSTAIPPAHGGVHEVASSGSTGQPVRLLATDLYVTMWQALTLRDHLWHRRDLGGKLAVIRSRAEGADYPAGLALASWGAPADIVYPTGPSVILHTAASLEDQAEWLLRHNPDCLLTAATRARHLAMYFRNRGLELQRLKEVRTYAETLAADLRMQCREAWGARVVDMYSGREVGYLALQCPEYEHYHVQSESVLVEILDAEDRPCAQGERGRVVVSTLHNFATPLLRYDIGDYAVPGGRCPCGRGLPVLERILGRVRNVLRLPDGSSRFPDAMLARIYRDLRDLPALQVQIAQTAIDALELRVAAAEPLAHVDRSRLTEYVRNWAGPAFKVELRLVESIPRGRGGKFEEFLSLIDPPQ